MADIPIPPADPIKNEPSASKPSTSKGVNSLFGAAPIKKETLSNGTSAHVKVKEEKSSPKKVISPKKSSPRNDSPKKKAAAKPPVAKSISSFFSSKPTASKPVATDTKEKAVKVETKAEPKVEPVAVKTEVAEAATPKESKKRVLSQSDDDSIPGTPQAKHAPANKKSKKAPANMKNEKVATNRSRIMQICDSSSDEEEATTSKQAMETKQDEGEVKKEKENTTPTKNSTPEAMDTEEIRSDTNGTQQQKKRGKVKKMMTKTFKDDDGFISEFGSEPKFNASNAN